MQTRFGGGSEDAAVAKFSPDGTRLLYATYLGGRGDEMVRSIAFGPDGAIYLVGSTSSPDFPVTSEGVQRQFGGGSGDAFLAKLIGK